jgi:hypothetical protein
MKTGTTALLVALGLLASTLAGAAQVRDVPVMPPAAVSETSPPQPVDATAAMRALLHDPVLMGPPGPAENAYDFNAPNSIPGFGPLDLPLDRRLAQVIWE